LLAIDVIRKTLVFLQVITQRKDAISLFLLRKKHSIIKAQIFAASETPILRQNVLELVGGRQTPLKPLQQQTTE